MKAAPLNGAITNNVPIATKPLHPQIQALVTLTPQQLAALLFNPTDLARWDQ